MHLYTKKEIADILLVKIIHNVILTKHDLDEHSFKLYKSLLKVPKKFILENGNGDLGLLSIIKYGSLNLIKMIDFSHDKEYYLNYIIYNKDVERYNYFIDFYKIDRFTDDVYNIAGQNGNLELVQWLYNIAIRKGNLDKIYSNTIQNACIYGHLDVVKWLYPEYKINLFDLACNSKVDRNFELIQWIYETEKPELSFYDMITKNYPSKVIKFLFRYFNFTDIYSMIIICLYKNKPRLLKWIYKKYKYMFDEINDYIFYIDNCNDDISLNNFFVKSYYHRNINVSKWIYSLGKIKGDLNTLYLLALKDNKKEYIAWLGNIIL